MLWFASWQRGQSRSSSSDRQRWWKECMHMKCTAGRSSGLLHLLHLLSWKILAPLHASSISARMLSVSLLNCLICSVSSAICACCFSRLLMTKSQMSDMGASGTLENISTNKRGGSSCSCVMVCSTSVISCRDLSMHDMKNVRASIHRLGSVGPNRLHTSSTPAMLRVSIWCTSSSLCSFNSSKINMQPSVKWCACAKMSIWSRLLFSVSRAAALRMAIAFRVCPSVAFVRR
mmetsp:Transcript_23443/g.58660  ORF Transcript_23443/g.58660 Transcript_23443/m.58660 type:complete len:232 (-) Transcript_23443:1897-2592(-)